MAGGGQILDQEQIPYFLLPYFGDIMIFRNQGIGACIRTG